MAEIVLYYVEMTENFQQSKTLISIVSPAYNEHGNIAPMIKEVKNAFLGLGQGFDFEYIIVDDGSQDNTWPEIMNEANKDQRIKGISLSRNFGQQIALSAGIDLAQGQALIFCDIDLQHPPSLFPQMISQWQNGAKVVNTIRLETTGINFPKKILSKIFYQLISFLSDLSLEEGMADFKLLDKEVYLKLRLMRERNRFLRGLIPWLGYPSKTIKYNAPKRLSGPSLYSFSKSLKLARIGILSMSTRPLKYVAYLGLFLTFSSMAGLVISLIIMVAKNNWRYISPTFILMLFNTLLIGLVLCCLGVVALYISFLYQEIIQRPLYIIEKKINL